jgi:hypothetical protein
MPIRWCANASIFGAQQNWDAYRQELFAQRIADEHQMTATMNQEALGGPLGLALPLSRDPAFSELPRRSRGSLT